MLELNHISYSVREEDGELGILNDISLKIPDRSLTVFTGPNGGGKTTLAKIIMTAVLALPAALRESPWLLPAGAAAATAVEYGFHWACDTLLGVRFWDYSAVRGNLRGRVCLPFSLAWGPLIAAALLLFQPPLGALIARIPPGVTLAAVLLLTLDALCSVRLLRLTHDPAALRLGALPDGMRLVFSPSAPRI